MNSGKMKTSLYIFPVLFFLFFFSFTSAQNVDSLVNAARTQTGKQKAETLRRLFNFYINKDIDSAGIWAERHLELAQKLNDPAELAYAKKNYGLYLLQKGKYTEAEKYIFDASELFRKTGNKKELAESYRWLAGVYFYKKQIQKALEYLKKALTLFTELNDYEGIADCYNNMGLLEKSVNNFSAAIKDYRRALAIINKHNLRQSKSPLFINLGIAYRYLQKYDSSAYYFYKAMKIDSAKRNLYNLASIYLNLAKLYMDQKQKDSVEYYLDKLIKLYPRIAPELQPTVLSTIGKWYYKTGQYRKAIPPLLRAYKVGVERKSWREQEYPLYYLYASYKALNQYDSALVYLEKLTDIQDSIEYKEAQVKIQALKEQYENEKKQLKIEQLERVKKLDRIIKYLLLFILTASIITFIITIRNYKKQRQRIQAEKKKIEEDLQLKNKQLTTQALLMMQKNKLLQELLQNIQELKQSEQVHYQQINKLLMKIKSGLQAEKDWELFRQYFEMVNKDFFKKLKEKYPSLTQSELKLSALIKLRLNIKQSATLLNISPDSIKTARYLLRKKFGLKRNENLYDFLNKI